MSRKLCLSGGLQSRFFPGNAGFQPASEFVGILPAQGGDFIPQPSRRLEACVPRDFAILLLCLPDRAGGISALC